jgi:alkylhydroperoxidase family enzyme
VAAWREAPFFTDAERAAPALTEAATRLALLASGRYPGRM